MIPTKKGPVYRTLSEPDVEGAVAEALAPLSAAEPLREATLDTLEATADETDARPDETTDRTEETIIRQD
jgi:hypothetical protein